MFPYLISSVKQKLLFMYVQTLNHCTDAYFRDYHMIMSKHKLNSFF